MDTEKQIRGFLYHRTNLSVIKNFGHTCLFKSLPRHLLEATGCRLCFGPAVKYGPEHNPHPVLLKSFWKQDLKSSFQEQFNHSVASYSSGLDILQSIKQQWKSFSFVWNWKKKNLFRDVVFEGRIYFDVQRLKFCMRQCQNAMESLMIDVFISSLASEKNGIWMAKSLEDVHTVFENHSKKFLLTTFRLIF